MSKAKTRATPSPQNRGKAGRARDSSGRFMKGASGNPGGRPTLPSELKELARSLSMEGLQYVAAMLRRETTSDRDMLAAVRLLMEYGYGRPAAELDRERLEIDRGRLDLERKRVEKDTAEAGAIEVIISPQGQEYGE